MQIDSFDDISGWSVWPENVIAQGTVAGGDPVKEGTGSLIADYTPESSGDNYYISKYITPLDFSAAPGATINLTDICRCFDGAAMAEAFDNAYHIDFG